ncbi:MAG: OmpW family outer membrane protein [Hyphomicrobium sp.]|jgi:outer membrane protein
MLDCRFTLALVAAMGLVAAPSFAGDSNGNFQAKLGVTGVWTDDSTNSLTQTLSGVTTDLLAAGASASTNDTVIPSLTLTYFLNKNLAVELFCCFDKINVDGRGLLNGVDLADVWVFPPALTLQYHFDNLGPIKPYVGVGAQWVHYFNENSNLGGFESVKFDDSFGFVLQAGVDYDLGGGWSLGLDVKKVWEDTKITWTAANGDTTIANHDIDPLIATANLGYRFNLSDIFGSRSAAPLK